jgi:Protein kinase domain
MNETASLFDALSEDALRRLDEVCCRFERAWQAGHAPRLEEALTPLGDVERPAFLRELLRLEVHYRRQSGEAVSAQEYQNRFPDAADVVRDLFAVAPLPEAVPAELAEHPRYRIVRLLGRGGMGTVFEAQHSLMRRRVALKVVNPRYLKTPGAVERFRREVQAAARLSHPNIVTAHDADKADNLHFLVMEYIEGVTICQLVHRHGPVAVAAACD